MFRPGCVAPAKAGAALGVSLRYVKQAPAFAGATVLALSALTTPGLAQEHDHSQLDHAQHQSPTAPESGDTHKGHATPSPAPTEGSGTARIPGNEGGMHGLHIDAGKGWMVMAHGYAWGVYTDQSGPRGDDKAYIQSMAMISAERPFEGGRVQLKSMMSLEPLMSNRGYPNLFATGETAGGKPLVDRQHPHDLFMELSARIDLEIADGTQAFLYGGPVGEPALGPSAFMHRRSARYNPEAPITHHWFDSTHITYGVVTLGVASRNVQIEGSVFTGREPDEQRWNIEKPRFDSWSVRASWTPSPAWAVQLSHGFLKQPEFLIHPDENEHRTTASIHYANADGLSVTAGFSAKNRDPGPTLSAFLVEANWDIDDHHSVFGRLENVRNDELFPDEDDPLHERSFRISKIQAGYAYRLNLTGPLNLAIGGTVSAFAKPDILNAAYGKNPTGFTLFAKLALGH
jgi:hypothetical protein